MTEPTLTQQLEAILFVAAEPLSAERLATATDTDLETTRQALSQLAARPAGGIVLSQLDGQYRLVSAPETTATVRRFLQAESKTDLSRPALETLAIIAYRGPLTKTDIEKIRGVASETMLRSLLSRNLVIEAGKSSQPGRPVLYAVSHGFLQHFGLTSSADLPPIADDPA